METVQNVQTNYRVKMVHSSETHVVNIENADGPAPGEFVIVTSRYGKDMARILGPCNCSARHEGEKQTFVRMATEKDIEIYEANLEKERVAVKTCRAKVAEHKLDMKLVSAHYLPDESKILFFFTADARVDFRALVKDLVSIFKMRIELRQIGVRDESRVLGGVAVCGRQYCCHNVTDRLQSVSIKMAKEQNLSLNSMKISGPCGRLLCCLSYEYDFYREEKKKLPSVGYKMTVKGTNFKVIEVNIQSQRVTLLGEDGRKVNTGAEHFYKEGDNSPWKFRGELED
ncbi:MAG: regulatory iron-sulfur-containing complex subunit RicT [Spirochaetales bacterium]|uniref:Regulatory iron-sulfur-containing complex subunit RicT n=1 Tax=Candidatus Thalassospirochaeta sargassi TaxID=3119039 RepID=A0AAJ1ICL6_9SPIO|nr:regulatory iron-sulfur-containing complex subunit RicT [Spirochaetales bacterium]